jgi:hypothetical protein
MNTFGSLATMLATKPGPNMPTIDPGVPTNPEEEAALTKLQQAVNTTRGTQGSTTFQTGVFNDPKFSKMPATGLTTNEPIGQENLIKSGGMWMKNPYGDAPYVDANGNPVPNAGTNTTTPTTGKTGTPALDKAFGALANVMGSALAGKKPTPVDSTKTATGTPKVDANGKPIAPGTTVDENGIPLTLGDKIQMASNFTSPLFNLMSAAQGYDKEPEMANKYAQEALNRLGNLRVRPDFNPIIAQANATREAINSGSGGMQRLASLLGVNNQVANTLGSAAIQVANQNTGLDQQFSQAQLAQGERDRAESIRAKGTTDMNKAAQFNMMSKAFEQLGPAVGTIGSGLNTRQETITMYNIMKDIFPDVSLTDFEKFMTSMGKENWKYSGGVKSFTPKKGS